MKRKKVCFIGDTPLHIMNCINLACNEFASDEYLKDIYIGHNFAKATSVADNVRKTGVFRNVYNFVSFNNVENSIFLRTISLLCPKKLFYRYNLDSSYNFEKYDIVLVYAFSYFSRTAILAMRESKFYLYEDGIGTYILPAINQNAWPCIVKLLNNTIFHKRLLMNFSITYLNNAKLYQGLDQTKCIQMNRINKKNIAMRYIDAAFEYKSNDIYKNRKIVYLTQPFYSASDNITNNIESNILYFLKDKCNEQYLVRVHPGQKVEMFQSYFVDEIENLWELECIEQITEDNILLNYFSTAAFEPAFLCDKKPYIIFLHKVFDIDVDDNMGLNMDRMIDALKEMYGEQKYKIKVPMRVEEVFESIMDICNTCMGY